jgi:hypothetical protein
LLELSCNGSAKREPHRRRLGCNHYLDQTDSQRTSIPGR